MANKTIPEYDAAGSIDASADQFLMWQSSSNTYKKINRNTILGSSAAPVTTTGTQTLQNKTLDNSNIITVRDDRFTIQDSGDVTKQANFELSGITAGQTRTLTVPDANLTIVGTATTQTLTNKTLTAPVINNGSITGTTITTDAIVGQSAATNGTVYGMSVTSGTIAAAGLASNAVTTAKIQDSAVTNAKVAAGFVVQVVNTGYSAVATGTTVIPQDDTIPQSGEGTEFMTQSITPKSSTNILVVEAIFFGSISNANDATMAIFRDSTADAIAAGSFYQGTATGRVMYTLKAYVTAGSTSATTFKVRVGPGSAATLTFNGVSGTRYYGAITKSSITVTEYKA